MSFESIAPIIDNIGHGPIITALCIALLVRALYTASQMRPRQVERYRHEFTRLTDRGVGHRTAHMLAQSRALRSKSQSKDIYE